MDNGSGVYVSEKDLEDFGGDKGQRFRNMRSGEKEELKVRKSRRSLKLYLVKLSKLVY